MIAILSPARNIRPKTPNGVLTNVPAFANEANQIADVLKTYSPWQLESLLDLGEERALRMFENYQSFTQAPTDAALSSYYGAAYRNMELADFSKADFDFAQQALVMLSALYGALRPYDAIKTHRLGLKRDFLVDGQDLYAFWGEKIYRMLFRNRQPVINLASGDYTKLFSKYLKPGDEHITCRFLIKRPGKPARGTVSTVRAARGRMARFIVKNRIQEPNGLMDFDWDGYAFNRPLSTGTQLVFIKDYSFGQQ